MLSQVSRLKKGVIGTLEILVQEVVTCDGIILANNILIYPQFRS